MLKRLFARFCDWLCALAGVRLDFGDDFNVPWDSQ